ncbi:MAG: beta-galactosidase [Haliangiales bacterium]
MRRMLGVCYYPEHWPESRWAEDARLMAGLGITYVRIGEFCWSRLEPARDQLRWGWLDRALTTLADAGLRVVLGTPTATPPKWLIDARPDILAHDDQGRPRRFGSRRHTCFSSPAWLEETRRIVELVASRYGPHPAVVGWQIDNEYGCHDTVRSYAPHCEPAFQAWLRRRYQHVDKLNQAWGTVFWSQEYADFDQVSLPHLTVTEANPAHRLDYARFSSDQVIAYHQLQAEIVAAHAPGRFIAHNVMGFFDQFDHFDLADHLDVCGWDSYPVGFTACAMDLSEDDKRRFARAGHPDAAAFQHDLYRSAVERRPAGGPDADAPAARAPGRMWVMEQQPGPVNWAPYNPAPPDSMVRLWTWEALAHGAEAVCYFRWRQIPRAQEQLHAALLRPDAAPAPAWAQAAQVSRELATLDERVPAWRQLPAPPAPVALLFDYQAAWMLDIQPHSVGPGYLPLVRRCYTALRRLGLDVDFVRPGGSLDGYALVVAPTLPIIDDATWQALQRTDTTTGATIIFGPRSGSRDHSFGIPAELPPGPLQQALPIVVAAIDSVRADMDGSVYWPTTGRAYPAGCWREHIDSELTPVARFDDTARGAIYRAERWHYFAFHPDEALWRDYLEDTCRRLGVATVRLPENLRLRRRGPVTFACNSGDRAIPAPMSTNAELILGADPIGPHDVAAWIEL